MKIAIAGKNGRMGQAISALAQCTEFLTEDPLPDVVVDFSSPKGTIEVATFCARHNVPFVTGTTGLMEGELAAVKNAANQVAVVQSGNMSLGITLVRRLVAEAATALADFDIEILETHHRHKKDSPSGTALLLGEAAARARGGALSERACFSRHGRMEERKPEEIGFAVRRGGGVYGEHEVSFMSEGETITLGHQALSRDAFAQGALSAASWVIGQPPGLYSMDDVLSSVL